MRSSISHVIFWVASSQRTSIVRISFLLSCLTWESKILASPTPIVRSSRTWTSSSSGTFVGSAVYFLNCDTWKTLCRLAKWGGKTISYAAGPILFVIWYGPMNLGVSFLDLITLLISTISVTWRNTWSPGSNSSGLLRLSAYDFYRL